MGDVWFCEIAVIVVLCIEHYTVFVDSYTSGGSIWPEVIYLLWISLLRGSGNA